MPAQIICFLLQQSMLVPTGPQGWNEALEDSTRHQATKYRAVCTRQSHTQGHEKEVKAIPNPSLCVLGWSWTCWLITRSDWPPLQPELKNARRKRKDSVRYYM